MQTLHQRRVQFSALFTGRYPPQWKQHSRGQLCMREVVTGYDPGLILIKIQYTQWLQTSADYKHVFAICRLVDICL